MKSASLQSGQQVGEYRIEKLLGFGGMAEVYLATDLRLERTVALKLLPPELARDESLYARFEREVQQISRLSHPNIVTLYEFGRDGSLVFYTMQALEQGDLAARIRGGALDPAEALRIMRRMADAFVHAHALGLAHRDVKPENILFDGDNEPVLTDFGIAKVLDASGQMTKTGMTVGTPSYISPEQARGRGVDARTDLYALGVIFYELLTGRVPYKGPDSFATIMLHLTEPLPQLPEPLARFQPLLDKLMAKDPDERYADAGELKQALRELRRQEGGATPPPPGRTRPAPPEPEPEPEPRHEQAPEPAPAPAAPSAADDATPAAREVGEDATQVMSIEELMELQRAQSRKPQPGAPAAEATAPPADATPAAAAAPAPEAEPAEQGGDLFADAPGGGDNRTLFQAQAQTGRIVEDTLPPASRGAGPLARLTRLHLLLILLAVVCGAAVAWQLLA